MDAARALLGSYTPGRTPWHRMPVAAKYLAFLVLVVAVLVAPGPVASGGVLAASLVLVATTRAPLRMAWGLPWGVVALLAGLLAFYALTGQGAVGVGVVATMLTALYAFRLVLLTTPMPALVDALVAAARPFRRLGVDPERFGLAVALMLRSVPFVAASFGEVRDAARARGLERNPVALVAPVVVQAVAFAKTTGEALQARGLGESTPIDSPT